jgi:hypothetical protein
MCALVTACLLPNFITAVLVFANRIKTVRFLHDTVKKEGYRAVMLHGARSQPEREEAMRDFRSGKAQVRRGMQISLVYFLSLVYLMYHWYTSCITVYFMYHCILYVSLVYFIPTHL